METDWNAYVRSYIPSKEPAPSIDNATGLDFGSSRFSEQYPGIPVECNMVFVPHKGELKPMDEFIEGYLQDEKAYKTSVNDSPAVNFRGPDRGYDITEIYLVWINERNEWIGIEKNSWVESSSCGMDDSYSPPKALNEKYGKKILEAYKIQEDKVSCRDALRAHPSKLEEIAGGSE